ncbi:MAG: hypothetical protein DMF63_11790 [Acidobacteria bacterium]|nr:MAG: hypothetical protein DMF63_11790 [Acidobacteriota bacterium]
MKRISLQTKSLLFFAALFFIAIAWCDLSVDSRAAHLDGTGASPEFSVGVTAYSTRSNFVVLHPGSGKIYASIPSSTDPRGNSIARIDPASGSIEQSTWIGSEPNKLALAPDGNTLYVGLAGSRSIRRFDISKNVPGSQFYAGFNTTDGNLPIVDFAVSPTDSNVVAVSRNSESSSGTRGVAIFDNGVQRPIVAGEIDALTFTNTESVLFGVKQCCSGQISRLSVNATGVSSVTSIDSPFNGNQISFVAGRIYSSSGHIAEVPSGSAAGIFSVVSAQGSRRAFVVDLPGRKAIYVTGTAGALIIEAFDIDTFVRIGGVALLNPNDLEPKAVARWGPNGLAISTDEGPTYFIQSDLIGPGGIPQAAPTPTPTPSTDLTAAVRRVALPNNDIIYNPSDQKIYASVPGVAGLPVGNTITRVDPVSGSILSSVFVGSEPGRLGISDDGSTLYTSLEGSLSISRFDTITQTAGLQFPRLGGSNQIRDLAVLPGNPHSIVVSAGEGGIAVYDDGILRPFSPNIEVGPIEHNGTPNTIYAYHDQSTGFYLYKLSVDANGLSVVSSPRNVIYRFNVTMIFDSGRLYCSDGRVVDPETNRQVGQFVLRDGFFTSYSVTVDSAARRAYFVSRNDDFVEVFDTDTFNKVGTIVIQPDPQAGIFVGSLFRWGRNGLAFRVPTQSGGYIALVQSPLVAKAIPFDFDGDGKTDIGIFRPAASGGEWWINRSSTGQTLSLQFGASTDRIAPADYTGDGKTDITVWRPSTGEWYVIRSEDNSFFAFPFGSNGDIPVPADYDADGKADAAVFRPSSATWFISQSAGDGTRIFQFGVTGDQPVVSDYDGDGKADVGIFRPEQGEWWVQRSTAGLVAMQFGASTDKPVQGDYTGDGKTDIAIWRPSTGQWLIVRSEDLSFYGFPFGMSGDVVAPGDYDGDGKFDATVFRPSSSTWFIGRTTAGTQIVQFGANGDRPLPNSFVP